jgi:hypothetical protein
VYATRKGGPAIETLAGEVPGQDAVHVAIMPGAQGDAG